MVTRNPTNEKAMLARPPARSFQMNRSVIFNMGTPFPNVWDLTLYGPAELSFTDSDISTINGG
jgi:hypothetical protein